MTNGLRTRLLGTFSDTTLPQLHDDPLLTAGSLLLVDPAHPANPWPAGVPADGSTVPNLAWRECKNAIGSGDQTTLAAPFVKSSAITGSVGLVERTTKGGLHIILSAGATLSSGQAVAIRLPLSLVAWFVANPNHSYFFSVWFKGTRFGNANGSLSLITLNASSSTSQLFDSMGPGGTNPGSGKMIGQRRTRASYLPSVDAAVTPPFQEDVIFNVGVTGYTGTPVTSGSTAQTNSKVFSNGFVGLFAELSGGLHSRLFRRAYIEDLTVSGRTYAAVDALDYAEYQTQCTTSGGRYYGDTYTDPATIT